MSFGERRWNDIDRGKPKNSGKNLSQCHFVHPVANPGLRGERPATNDQIFYLVKYFTVSIIYFSRTQLVFYLGVLQRNVYSVTSAWFAKTCHTYRCRDNWLIPFHVPLLAHAPCHTRDALLRQIRAGQYANGPPPRVTWILDHHHYIYSYPGWGGSEAMVTCPSM
jgi:hypothetical protein